MMESEKQERNDSQMEDSNDNENDSPINKNQNWYINNGMEMEPEKLEKKDPETELSNAKENDPPVNEGTERDTFTNPIEFLLSILAMSVGLGNFYRFPFVAYENGGGAFLIPYLIVLLVIGRPMYYLELTLGQFTSYSQVKCWKLNPLFKGVGYGSTFATYCITSYYVTIMAITVFYFFSSFQTDLPWNNCKESWAGNGTCAAIANFTENDTRINLPELYFENEVLKSKATIDDGIGYPDWRLSLCLLLSWLAIFFSIVKGVKSLGKVSYFTAIFPYIVILIFLITGLTREGAVDGIIYFIEPKWEKIIEPGVWFAAIGQCFFSLGVGLGPIIMYSSYNRFSHNVHRDAMIVSIMDTFTSLLSGFTVFAILGNLAVELDVEISEVASKSGPGLIFVSYADAISKFDYVPQLFAVLFFLMLFTLGVGTAVSTIMAVISVLWDQFPGIPQIYITSVTCGSCFLFGLVYLTPGGQHILTLVDHFAGTFSIYVLVTFEITGIVWIYGYKNYFQDLQFMFKEPVGIFWKVMWGFITPICLIGILIYFLVDYKPVKQGNESFPVSGYVSGWLVAAIGIGCVPICALHTVFTRKADTLIEKFKMSVQPTKNWGPRDAANKAEWLSYKEQLNN